jgi:alanyl-tRNA synthetase
MVSTSEIRERFLAFFAKNGHQVVSSSSLVPGNDKTLLFTNAGMVQFKDVFTGEEVRDYKRATTSQRCVRAGGKHNDLDNVGYTARHHTFFEMLGNFSFGDYFKEEAIAFAWQFLTEDLQIPAEKLWITVFEEDDEAEAIWRDKMGVPAERVIRIGAKDNFWMMGDTGPCGPCSEIFYDHGEDVWGGPPGTAEEDGDRYIEIWNLVFMQYDKDAAGTLHPLPKPCVDTGMGLERMAAVLQHVHSNYEIDLFQRLLAQAAKLTGTNDLSNPSLNVVADHIRSCAFLIADGVLPSNEGRGYVLRRIIRRAARHGHKLGATDAFFHQLTAALVKEMGEAYPELAKAEAHVTEQLLKEEQRFAKTLSAGLKILDEEVSKLSDNTIPGDVVFRLYDTYGFPVDLTADIARERDLGVDTDGFEVHMEAQRARARAASNFAAEGGDIPSSQQATIFLGYTEDHSESSIVEIYVDGETVEQAVAGQAAWLVLDKTPFYGESGGQVGDTGSISSSTSRAEVLDTKKYRQAFLHAVSIVEGELKVGDAVNAAINGERRQAIKRHHSATHLLHGALRHVLGDHVEQKGSLVNDSQLRFDFSHGEPVTEDQQRAIEAWMQTEVATNSPCNIDEMSMDDAIAAGAMALFGEKYGEVVRVVKLGDRSIELCGGTHVNATGDLGLIKVTGETGVAAGVRRIEAVSGAPALQYVQSHEEQLSKIARLLKSSSDDVYSKVEQLQLRGKELKNQVEQLQARLSSQAGKDMLGEVASIQGVPVLMKVIDSTDAKGLRTVMDQLKQDLPDSALVLASESGGKAVLVASVSKALHDRIKAGDLLRIVAQELGGKGGGRADMAQGGAESLSNVKSAFAAATDYLNNNLAS